MFPVFAPLLVCSNEALFSKVMVPPLLVKASVKESVTPEFTVKPEPPSAVILLAFAFAATVIV